MDQSHELIEEQGFKGRTELLRRRVRYGDFSTVFYRSNLYRHTLRVEWLCNYLAPMIKSRISAFDEKKAFTLALVHDDYKLVPGNSRKSIPSRNAFPFSRNNENGNGTKREEENIRFLSTVWPETVNEYNYNELLISTLKKDSVEAQIVSVMNDLDGLCQSLHEIFAGNRGFYEGGREGVRPPTRGSEFRRNRDRSRFLLPLLEDNYHHPIFGAWPETLDVRGILSKGKPHTLESIQQQTGLAHYDLWKRIVIERGGEEGILWLTEKRE